MFDRVLAPCPECGHKVEFQSKAGKCVLASYDIEEVPIAIAENIDGMVKQCSNCGHYCRIHLSSCVPINVRMTIS
jgi:hypothetical protein